MMRVAVLLVGGCVKSPRPPLHTAGDASGMHTAEGLSGAWTRYVPASTEALGVAVLLHADDATPVAPTRDPRLRALAEERGLMLLAVDSPGPVDSGCWWSPHKHLRARYLDDLLRAAAFEASTIDRERIYLVGKSGGAFWASGVPFYGDWDWRGGIVGVCGGDVPRVESPTDWCAISELEDDPVLELTASQRNAASRWRAFFVSTSQDAWRHTSQAAATLFRDLGASVSEVDAGPGGHCELDAIGWMIDGLRWVDTGRSPGDGE